MGARGAEFQPGPWPVTEAEPRIWLRLPLIGSLGLGPALEPRAEAEDVLGFCPTLGQKVRAMHLMGVAPELPSDPGGIGRVGGGGGPSVGNLLPLCYDLITYHHLFNSPEIAIKHLSIPTHLEKL